MSATTDPVEDRSVFEKPEPQPDFVGKYGELADHVFDVFRGGSQTLVLIHGGYWRPEYDRKHLRNFAQAFSKLGYTVISLEYRRIPGDPDAMVSDIKSGIEHIAQKYGPVIVIGHSAGGHLALWAAENVSGIKKIIALAPVGDLASVDQRRLDNDAAREFLGRPASERADLDPMTLSLMGIPTTIIHGALDIWVPIDLAHNYIQRKRIQGENVRFIELPTIGHFELIDCDSSVWPVITQELL